MAREIVDWFDESQVSRKDFWSLALPGQNASDHNVYVMGYGYLDDHILDEDRRDLPEHWDGQYERPEGLEKAWPPRPGPRALVLELASQNPIRLFRVGNFGAGTGDFTLYLVQARENIFVTHVDFSTTANGRAKKKFEAAEISHRVAVITDDNRSALERLLKNKENLDFIFFYGGLADNTPLERDTEETLKLGVAVLRPGGYLWYVGLEQPMLLDWSTRRATDIKGEYPSRPGFVEETLLSVIGIHLVGFERGERPDTHQLIRNGPDVDHIHQTYRGLFVKELPDGTIVETPSFKFK